MKSCSEGNHSEALGQCRSREMGYLGMFRQKCHQEGTGPGAPHCPLEPGTLTHRKYRSVLSFQQLNSRSKEPRLCMCFAYYQLCLCLPEGLSNNVDFNYFNEKENDLRSVSSMGQGPDGNAKSGIISSAVNSTLSEAIGAKCKQLLEPD